MSFSPLLPPALADLPAHELAHEIAGGGWISVVRTAAQFAACQDIRLDVFVGEQQVPLEEELDDADFAPHTIHFLLTVPADQIPASSGAGAKRGVVGQIPVGTARLLLDQDDRSHAHIGRVAIIPAVRGTGLGRVLMEAIAQLAQRVMPADPDTGEITLELSSQVQAMGFYQSLGYIDTGGECYLDAGIEHRDMKLALLGL